MANLLSRVMHGIQRLPHRVMSEVDRASMPMPIPGGFGVENQDEREAKRRRERGVRPRSVEEDDSPI
jgi:hypothetical protein